ncbi:MAG: acetyl-CoA decarbonylase/synthase complex subunit gamma [Candidatus Omnitrophota bacterium]|jgi:acetyl-CoA decarbonylase/synthase complex subunit gamma
MALSGLDIYKILPKTNCKECGFVTCLAFAMQLAKKGVEAGKCPYLSEEAGNILADAGRPPINLVSIGSGDGCLKVGNETVLFRHEEKFRNPCGIGFIMDDALPGEQIKRTASRLGGVSFERVGQTLKPDVIAVRQSSDSAEKFAAAVKTAADASGLNPVLMPSDASGLRAALEAVKGMAPLVYRVTKDNIREFMPLAAQARVPAAVYGATLEEQAELVKELNGGGVTHILLDTGEQEPRERIWRLTQWRRQALKKNNRLFGYPAVTVLKGRDPYAVAVEAAGYICKYAGLILLEASEAEETLALLTLRQNIYSDPQKPLQIEPKVYTIGNAGTKSPVLVTTNFSLTYFTVLGEVESSKVPSYIVSVDTEGMSVLTAWAAEKFTPEKITDSLQKFGVSGLVGHNRLIIPGYVAMMSGNLEEKSGWEVVVGPKEASGLPAFLKNLS